MNLDYMWEYVYYIIVNLGLLRFLTLKFEKKYTWIWGIIIVECIGFTIINPQSLIGGTIFSFGTYLLSVFLFYKEPIKQRMFIGVFILCCNMLTPVLSFFMTFGIYSLALHTVVGEFLNIRIIIEYISPITFLINIILVQIFIYKISRYEIIKGLAKDKKTRIYMSIIILLGFMTESIPYILKGHNIILKPQIGMYSSIIAILLLAIIIIMGFLIAINYQKQEVINEKIELDTKLNILENHIESNDKMIEKKNIVLHDVKNHMSVIKSMLALGDEEEILSYMNDLDEGISEIYKNKISGNSVIDSILLEKGIICKENNIRLDIECLIPSVIKIKQFDLVTIVASLLDNAIKENLENKEECEKYIHISINFIEDILMIKIENLTKDKNLIVDEEFIFSENKYKSYGIQKIRDIIKKYNGAIKFRNENYKLTITAYLSCIKRMYS